MIQYLLYEIWFDIPGYEGYYKVSNLNRIKSVRRIIMRSDGKIKTLQERLRKCYKNENGYWTVALNKSGKTKTMFIHVIIGKLFYPHSCDLPETNHLDGNKNNNHPYNLKKVTRLENIEHAFTTGLIIPAKGEQQSNTKLNNASVLEILNDPRPSRKIASDYGVVHSCIICIKIGKTWNHITGLPRKTKRKHEVGNISNQ